MKTAAFATATAILLALGLCGDAAALQVATVSIQTRDLVYNPADGRLYASVPSSVPTYGNSVTAIDPATGALGPSVFVGSEPGKLALSDDGRTLYVALQGSAAVRVVDLEAMTAGLQFTLGSDSFFGPYYAEDMSVQPGHPNTVAISLMYLGVSPRHAGVAVFDDGVARATRTPGHTGSNRIEFSSDPTRIYGYNNETTEFGFRRLLVSDTGVTQVDVTSNLIAGFGPDILYAGGRIYSTNGTALDPEARTILGTFAFQGFDYGRSVAVDAERAYYLAGDYGQISLYEFDPVQFTPVLSQPVPGAFGSGSGLVRWGDDGLAFRNDSQVFLLTHIHEPPTCDLAVTQTDSSDPIVAGSSVTYRVAVRNLGASTATGVVARDLYPTNSVFQYAYSSSGYCSDSTGTVVCGLGSIAPGDSAIISVGVFVPNAGTLVNTAWAATPVLDTDPANDLSTETTLVTEPQFADISARLSHSPAVGSVGGSLSFTTMVGNAGPDSASSVTMSQQFYGVPYSFVSATSSQGTCISAGGYVTCSLGNLAAGDSAQVVVVVVPNDTGTLYSQIGAGSHTQDPNHGDNSVFDAVEVRLSAETLLANLVTLVQSYQLRNGIDKSLVSDLQAAAADLGAQDTSSACHSIGDFRRRVGKLAGRHLTLSQAIRLDSDADRVGSLLGCQGAALAASFARSQAEAPRKFSFRSMARAGDTTPRVALSLPAAARARLDVFDVQGRLVKVAHDQELSAGYHELVWDGRNSSGVQVSAGVYFLRLTAGKDREVARVTVLR